jgi:hypothetical protein
MYLQYVFIVKKEQKTTHRMKRVSTGDERSLLQELKRSSLGMTVDNKGVSSRDDISQQRSLLQG